MRQLLRCAVRRSTISSSGLDDGRHRLSTSERRRLKREMVDRFLRVDHAGEFGANRWEIVSFTKCLILNQLFFYLYKSGFTRDRWTSSGKIRGMP